MCRVPPSFVYGSPYLGAAAASAAAANSSAAAAAGLVPIPATQLSHAAAIAAATSQFYEYQVGINYIELVNLVDKFILLLQNAVAAAAAAPYPGQYAGFEAYPYGGAAAGEIFFFISSEYLLTE